MSVTDRLTILCGDALEQLRTLPEASVQCCVTSPPYWGLRDYGVTGQIGLERMPEEYVEKMVEVFREVRRVLKPDGTAWVNLGDCYASSASGSAQSGLKGLSDVYSPRKRLRANHRYQDNAATVKRDIPAGFKTKDLIGMPWRLAFALQADGWWLRCDIVWHKPNPMPESVTDRPTRAHEYVFLLSKSARYYYDAEAIAEPVSASMLEETEQGYEGHLGLKDYEANGVQNPSSVKERIIANARKKLAKHRTTDPQAAGHRIVDNVAKARANGGNHDSPFGLTRNKRSVWTVNTECYPEAHFATYPEELIKPCILAGCPAGGIVLDPFAGSGTTGKVALELGRKAVLIELNPEYVKLIERRCDVTPGLPI